ncbi:hypothetical protein E5161_07810 [Cohnella pontilimi]|uniref:Uncharacterized protein n=1 Tax=Cohnella pontilimi TaxID=2564100 RepID=A0A4U0FDE3_9BACL|nr:hypothetical protein [Cohnella pontilimi]TJY42738.1 hypothetical protein E5161_07810 [Cohnella pontilimi]
MRNHRKMKKIAIGVGVCVALFSLGIIGYFLYGPSKPPLPNHSTNIKPVDITSTPSTYALTNEKTPVDVEVEMSREYAAAITTEDQFTALLNAIDTQQKARYIVKKIHQSLNERTGFGHYRALLKKSSSGWDSLQTASFMDDRLYAKLAEIIPEDKFVQDMNHAAALSNIAKKKHSVAALLYLHRIFHDLDYWAFRDGSKGGDFWGVTETVKSDKADHVDEVTKFIAKH